MKKYGLKIGIIIILALVLTLSLILFSGTSEQKEVKAENADEYYNFNIDIGNVELDTDYTIILDETNTVWYYNEQRYINTANFNKIVIRYGSRTTNKTAIFYNGNTSVLNCTFEIVSSYYRTRYNVIAFSLKSYNINNLSKDYFFKSIGSTLNISSQINFSNWWDTTPQDIQDFITYGIGYWNTYDTNTNNGQNQANNPPISFSDVDKGYSGWELYINALLDNYDLQLQNARNTIEQQQATIEQQNAQLNELAPYMALDIVEGLFTSLGSLFNITIGPIPLYVFLLIPIILMIIYLIFKLMR